MEARKSGVPFIDRAGARAVDIRDVVELLALRPGIFDPEHQVVLYLAFKRQAVPVGIGGADVWIHGSQADSRKSLGTCRSRERPSHVCGYRIGCNVRSRNQGNNCVIRWILDHVKRDVAKIPFVGNLVSAAQAGLSVPEHIPREAHIRAEIIPIRRPESSDGAVGCDSHTAVADPVKDAGSGSKVEVGVKSRVLVMLDAEVFPADSQVYHNPTGNLPRILAVNGVFVVAVAPGEDWLSDGQVYRASRCDGRPAGVLSLRIDRALGMCPLTI